jgi:hypothetical protein
MSFFAIIKTFNIHAPCSDTLSSLLPLSVALRPCRKNQTAECYEPIVYLVDETTMHVATSGHCCQYARRGYVMLLFATFVYTNAFTHHCVYRGPPFTLQPSPPQLCRLPTPNNLLTNFFYDVFLEATAITSVEPLFHYQPSTH